MDSPYVRRLGEVQCTREDGRVGTLDLLVQAGLPVPEGVVLKREAHRCFLESSGLAGRIRSSAHSNRIHGTARQQALYLRRSYQEYPLEESLSRSIRGALLDLGAQTVTVCTHERSERGLGTIPAVFGAIRRAWLSTNGLKRQIEAVSRNEELPMWPILIQREVGY